MLWRVAYEDNEEYGSMFTVGVYSTTEKAKDAVRQVLAELTVTSFYKFYVETVKLNIDNLVIVPQPVDDEVIELDHRQLAQIAEDQVTEELQQTYAEAYNANPDDYGHYLINRGNK